MADLEELFRQVECEPIRGGCDRCDAYQTVSEDESGLWTLVVHHDDWCPVWKRKREAEAR